MSRVEKLKRRLEKEPKDFTYEEARKLLKHYGFVEDNKGKTSGSRVIFFRKMDGKKIMLHKPHPENTMKHYAVKQLKGFLNRVGEYYE